MKKIKTILVVKNRALGDSIIGLGAIQYLKTIFPNAKIIYAIPGWITPLYKNVLTAADEIISIDLRKIQEILMLQKALSSHSIDAIFELHQSGRSSKFLRFYSFFKKIPYFFHNHNILNPTRIIDQGLPKASLQRDLDGIYSIWGQNINRPHFLDYAPQLRPLNIDLSQKQNIIIGIIATRPTKVWPLSYYKELIKMISKVSSSKIILALSRGSFDSQLIHELQKMGKLPSSLEIHYPQLEDLPKLFSNAKIYIGNDTGQKHLACALGIKTLTFFGPENPAEWHPYDTKKHPYIFINEMPCRTKTAHFCGLSHCESMICLKEISPNQVFDIILNDIL